MHLLSFEPYVTKLNWKLKEDIDFLEIKDSTYLLKRKVLKYKRQDESKEYDSGDFRCVYFKESFVKNPLKTQGGCNTFENWRILRLSIWQLVSKFKSNN